MRLVYLVKEEERWTIFLTRAFSFFISAVLLIIHGTYIDDEDVNMYCMLGTLSRALATLFCIFLVTLGCYYTHKL